MTTQCAALRFLCLVGVLWVPLFAVSLRVEPPEYRPWEIVAEPDAMRFAPSRKLEMEELGDVGSWTWVRALQTPHRTTFTTDRFGRRNPDADSALDPRIVVVGDSFVGGSGLTDTATLTAHMSEKLGESVYNYAYSTMRMPALFLADPRFGEHPPQVVVFAPNQRNLHPDLLTLPPPRKPKTVDKKLEAWLSRIELSSDLTRLARYTLNGTRFELFGHDDVVRLPDGTVALRLSLKQQQLSLGLEARGLDRVVRAVVDFNQQLSQRGIRFVFAPIPDHANVYPELYSEAERARIVTPALIDHVIAAVNAQGVMVVDVPALYRAYKWPYLYQRDDSHWNEHAVELTAEVISMAVRPLLTAPAPTAAQR